VRAKNTFAALYFWMPFDACIRCGVTDCQTCPRQQTSTHQSRCGTH
jgi:hypothetical protein